MPTIKPQILATTFTRLQEGFDHGDKGKALDALLLALSQGAEVPSWAKTHVLGAIFRFRHFQAKSLGEAFGVPDHKNINALQDNSHQFLLVMMVEDLVARGVPLADNADGPGAFSQVADIYKDQFNSLSEYKVRDAYNAARKKATQT